MSNVATLPTGKSNFSLAPQSLDEAMRFADIMSKSAIVPKDYQGNPGNILVAVQWGAEIGLPPLQAMQNIAVVNGRPSIWGDAMIALVKGSGLLESMNEDIDADHASCTVKRRGEQAVTRTFTMEDAKRAGLSGKQGPWSQYPKRMLQMRARAWALRDVFPDVLKGVYIAEESRDLPEEKDVTAESSTVEETKTASRAEKARAALADRRKEVVKVPVVDLGEVVAAIQRAETPEQMQEAAHMSEKLEGDDKNTARKAYKDRLEFLKKQQTGNDQADAPGMSYAEVASALEKAENKDDFDAACDLIQHVGNATQRDELSHIVRRRLTEFKAQ